MSIWEVVAETQEEERHREIYLDYLIKRLILVVKLQHKYGKLLEDERVAIIEACNEGGKYKSKYAIELLELLNK